MAREAFWSKVRRTDGCWTWTAAKNLNGYGLVWADGKLRSAHRLAYEMAGGVIPDGWEVDHLCLNRACVRPEHLEAVTGAENRRRQGERKIRCVNGHRYDALTTYIDPRGKRGCRPCRTAAVTRSKSRKGSSVGSR